MYSQFYNLDIIQTCWNFNEPALCRITFNSFIQLVKISRTYIHQKSLEKALPIL